MPLVYQFIVIKKKSNKVILLLDHFQNYFGIAE